MNKQNFSDQELVRTDVGLVTCYVTSNMSRLVLSCYEYAPFADSHFPVRRRIAAGGVLALELLHRERQFERRTACVGSLTRIRLTKLVYAEEHGLTNGAVIPLEECHLARQRQVSGASQEALLNKSCRRGPFLQLHRPSAVERGADGVTIPSRVLARLNKRIEPDDEQREHVGPAIKPQWARCPSRLILLVGVACNAQEGKMLKNTLLAIIVAAAVTHSAFSARSKK